MHSISDLPLGKDSIQGDGIVLDNGPMASNISCVDRTDPVGIVMYRT